MRYLILILIQLISVVQIYAQRDTVFMRHSHDWTADSITYVTDTLLFSSGMHRNILIGTTTLPWTHNQMAARGFGLHLDTVTKSDCQKHDESVYYSPNKINSILRTDSTLIVDINIYDNCCYDFLCDIAVDSSGILDLIYYGYGTYCSCDCCFGLTYHFSISASPDYGEVKGVIINGNKKTQKGIKK